MRRPAPLTRPVRTYGGFFRGFTRPFSCLFATEGVSTVDSLDHDTDSGILILPTSICHIEVGP